MKTLLQCFSFVCLSLALSFNCTAKTPHISSVQKKYTLIKKNTSTPITEAQQKLAIQPTQNSLVEDATKRIKNCLKNGESSIDRVVCTYEFDGTKQVNISTKMYSSNYHEKPTLKVESYNATQKAHLAENNRRFEVIYKSCNPEHISLLEKHPKFHNQRLKSTSIQLPSSYIA